MVPCFLSRSRADSTSEKVKNLFPLASSSAGSESVTEEFDTAASAIVHVLEGVAFRWVGCTITKWYAYDGNSGSVAVSATDRWE